MNEALVPQTVEEKKLVEEAADVTSEVMKAFDAVAFVKTKFVAKRFVEVAFVVTPFVAKAFVEVELVVVALA